MPLALLPVLELIGAVSAGLFLSGCAGSKKDPEHPRAPQPIPPEPVLGFTEKENRSTYRLFQEMIRADKPPSLRIFDRGYQIVNYGYSYPQGGLHCPDRKAPFCLKGGDNGRIEPEEVWDSALHEEKYRAPLQKILGRRLSWLLEDDDPKDGFDVEQLQLAGNAIKFIETLLQKQGLKPGSPEFQEKLAVALCILVAVPERKKMEEHRAEIDGFLKALDAMHLAEWKSYLWEHGGLGLSEDKKEDELLELSALEARKLKKGQCTELSKILYAVLKLAKLRPAFVSVNLWQTDVEKVREKLNANPAYGHVCLAVFIGDKIRLLDPALASHQPPHREYYLLSLRHFLSLEQINYAEFWHWKGARGKAMEQFQQALDIDPTNPIAYFGRGIYNAKGGRYDEAIADFSQGLKLDPFYSVAFMLRGQVHGEKQDWDSAMSDLDRAIALQPNMAHAFYNRGQLWYRQENWVKAIFDLDQAVRFNPTESLYVKLRGKSFANLNQWDKALEDFKKVMEQNPEDKENNFLIGVAFIRNQKQKEALIFLNRYVSQFPLDPQGFDQRGLAWGLSGQWDKALSDFNEAFRLSPIVHPVLLQHRGVAWLQLGNIEKCRQDLAAFLKLSPKENNYLLRDIAGTFEYISKQNSDGTDLKNALTAETGLEISKAKAQALLSGVYWDIGEKDAAVEKFDLIFEAGWNGKPSARARKFFKELFQYLPESMRKEPEIQKWWKAVSVPQPSPNSLSLR